jgi:5-methyltetrahydrofolate--homocysteine methyltransferase
MTDEQLSAIRDNVIGGKRADALAQIDAALAAGADAKRIMTEALIPAMSIVGEKYSSGEFFLPQMMIAAKAMSECMQHIGARLVQAGYERKGKALLGTVAGDFHDIGKNIVKLMLEGNGWEVVDLGVDVSPEAFVEAIRREAPHFVLMSALITLTMESMRRTVEAMEAAGVRAGVRVGVGGAPVTQKFAEEIRADFYGADAYACVEHCNRLMHSMGVHR